MENLKFLTLLATLAEDEVSAFHKFLKQSYVNERIALELFEYILKFYPKFDNEKKLDMNFVAQKIFGANKVNRKRVLNTLSELHIWLKNFLLMKMATEDSLESRLSWLLILQQRGLEKEFLRQSTRIQHDLHVSSPEKNTMEYLQRMMANYIVYSSSITNELMQKIENLHNFRKSLNNFYSLANLNIDCALANLKNLNPASTDLPNVVSETFQHSSNNHPLLLLYQEVYRLINDNNEESYFRIETILSDQVQNIDPRELYNVISYLHNYAGSQIKSGKVDFWERIHNLNKFSIQYNIFTSEGIISATQFTNVISVACRMKDFDWAYSFIAQQSMHLPEDVRIDTVYLVEAIIMFEKKNFKQVLKLLRESDFKTLGDNIRSRALILRSLYELGGEIEVILDFCAAFESFLRRNRKPKTATVEATIAFVRIFRMLLLEKNDKDDIVKTINDADPLFFRPWLLEKVTTYKRHYIPRK